MTINLTELERLAKAAPDGPYFAADDAAADTIPHRNSGLALVDTGRIADSEWPIARLCEWGSANYIAALDPQTVLALIRCARAAVQLDDAYERGSDGHNLAGRIKAVRVIARDFEL